MRTDAPDIFGTVYDCVREFAIAGPNGARLDDDRILRGRQNSAALPEGPADYAIFILGDIRPRGTTFEQYNAENEILSVGQHWQADFRVTFYSMDGLGLFRALSLYVMFGGEAVFRLFRAARMAPVSASVPRQSAEVTEGGVYVDVTEVTLTVEFDSWVRGPRPGSTFAPRAVIEDVDAFHPPRRT